MKKIKNNFQLQKQTQEDFHLNTNYEMLENARDYVGCVNQIYELCFKPIEASGVKNPSYLSHLSLIEIEEIRIENTKNRVENTLFLCLFPTLSHSSKF